MAFAASCFSALAALGTTSAFAHEDKADQEEHKNLKVIQHTGSSLKKSMKNFSKGLGVKCSTCHIKKDYESEEKALKDKSRPFFRATVGEPDLEKRKKALTELLKILELEKARDEARLWKGIDAMKKKG